MALTLEGRKHDYHLLLSWLSLVSWNHGFEDFVSLVVCQPSDSETQLDVTNTRVLCHLSLLFRLPESLSGRSRVCFAP